MNYLYLNELIGYVDLLDLNETWVKSLSAITAPKRVEAFAKIKKKLCDILLNNNNSSQKIFCCPTLKEIS